ncbi:MAG: hypothetical protein HWD86_00980 [Kangiellaceae bacterium]|nr:hypothetical protein [Kangiellaceae bacterium]
MTHPIAEKIAKLLTITLFCVLLMACKSSDKTPSNPSSTNNTKLSDYEVLLMGNSHSAYNNLPGMLAILIQAGTQKTVNVENAPGWKFLDERLNDGVSEQMLKSRKWTHLVLQAQKYSTTGNYFYSTEPSEEWIRRAKAQNAIPIMFPEWARKGNLEEGDRIHQLHLSIVSAEPACLAPIGLAWENARLQYPQLNLHDPDGNHSNKNGALLTAYVLYETITGNKAEDLATISQLGVDASIQIQLKGIASLTVEQNPPCFYYPQ